jgi:hypothetical protein
MDPALCTRQRLIKHHQRRPLPCRAAWSLFFSADRSTVASRARADAGARLSHAHVTAATAAAPGAPGRSEPGPAGHAGAAVPGGRGPRGGARVYPAQLRGCVRVLRANCHPASAVCVRASAPLDQTSLCMAGAPCTGWRQRARSGAAGAQAGGTRGVHRAARRPGRGRAVGCVPVLPRCAGGEARALDLLAACACTCPRANAHVRCLRHTQQQLPACARGRLLAQLHACTKVCARGETHCLQDPRLNFKLRRQQFIELLRHASASSDGAALGKWRGRSCNMSTPWACVSCAPGVSTASSPPFTPCTTHPDARLMCCTACSVCA